MARSDRGERELVRELDAEITGVSRTSPFAFVIIASCLAVVLMWLIIWAGYERGSRTVTEFRAGRMCDGFKGGWYCVRFGSSSPEPTASTVSHRR